MNYLKNILEINNIFNKKKKEIFSLNEIKNLFYLNEKLNMKNIKKIIKFYN